MGLMELRSLKGDGFLGIWNVNESLAELRAQLNLSAEDLVRLDAIHHELGKLQWLSVRILLKQVLKREVGVVYNVHGKPALADGSYFISISHSDQRVAVICHPNREVGIDIQRLNPKLERIERKFMSEQELQHVGNHADKLASLHIYWGGKEALYKLYGKKRVDFRKHLAIAPGADAKSGSVAATIDMPPMKTHHRLAFEWLEDYALVYVLMD